MADSYNRVVTDGVAVCGCIERAWPSHMTEAAPGMMPHEDAGSGLFYSFTRRSYACKTRRGEALQIILTKSSLQGYHREYFSVMADLVRISCIALGLSGGIVNARRPMHHTIHSS